jgi:hypothetical protein
MPRNYMVHTLMNDSEMQKSLETKKFSFDIKGNLDDVVLSKKPFIPIGSFHSEELKRDVPVGLKYLKQPSEDVLFRLAMGKHIGFFEAERFQYDNAWANLLLFAENQPQHIPKLPLVFSLATGKTGYPFGVLVEDLTEGRKKAVVDLGKTGSKPYMNSVPELKDTYDSILEEFIKGNHGVEGAISAVLLQQDGDNYRVRFFDTDQLVPSLRHNLYVRTRFLMVQKPETEIEFPVEYLFGDNKLKLGYAHDLLEAIESKGSVSDMQLIHIRSERSLGIDPMSIREVKDLLVINGNIMASSDPDGRRVTYQKPELETSPSY